MIRLVLLPVFCAALPQSPELVERIKRASESDENTPCHVKECQKPDSKYELISKSQPGVQWGGHGGYCGSWSVQRAILAKGAWISQQQVRDHTSPAPGAPEDHDNEILSSNIDEALRNLKIDGDGFDFKNTPLPQQATYLKWLKKQLVAGHTVVWMIMWSGDFYPAYNMQLPYGVHGHVEPVIGIQSNHALTDDTVYDDDVAVHYDDAGTNTYYSTFQSLPGNWSSDTPARCQNFQTRYCVGPYSYGWAFRGFSDKREGLPLSLSIDPWMKEPEPREGESPIDITGTVTATGLNEGSKYDIYRWDSVQEAFTYNNRYKITTFTATNHTFVFKDPQTFKSDSTTYYRCVKASGDPLEAPASSSGGAALPTALQPLKTCYWYRGFDARGVNNTSWDGPGANGCTSGPTSKKPCTKEDCCQQCQRDDMRSPFTGERCMFVIWNPTASKCFFKTAGAVAFAKDGDVTCCPEGQLGCPSAPPGGPWTLLPDFSDEFAVNAQGTTMMPLNTTKWQTSVPSWSNWTWAPENVKIVAQLPGDMQPQGDTENLLEIPNASGYAAITMSFEEHQRGGKTYFYKSGIMKSTLPAGVLYGRFEARIKGASRWPGVCPAFWAWRHSDHYWTELDFMEMQENPSSRSDIDFTSHVFPPTPGVEKHLSNSTHKIFDFDPHDDFHVYAMEWNSTLLTWWVDNKLVKQTPSSPYFSQGYPMDLALSFGLRPPLRLVPNATGFPTTFYVDWVRTWQRKEVDSELLI